MQQETQRRAMDVYPFDIERLIADENDPKQRAFLIVLNNINKSLVANTEVTQQLSKDFQSHVEEFAAHASREEALLNQGRGMWKILTAVLAALNIITGYGWVKFTDHLESIDKNIVAGQQEDTSIKGRISALENAK